MRDYQATVTNVGEMILGKAIAKQMRLFSGACVQIGANDTDVKDKALYITVLETTEYNPDDNFLVLRKGANLTINVRQIFVYLKLPLGATTKLKAEVITRENQPTIFKFTRI